VAKRRAANGEESGFVYSFPASALPPGIAERFTALFDHRLHWSFGELEPYIRSYCGGETTTGVLLGKYTRSFIGDDGERVYRRR
jgi:hypothetical protein